MSNRSPDVITLINDQHTTIRQLLNEIDASAPSERREAFEPLVRLLAVHETAEEEIVYPSIRLAGGNADEVVEARKHEEDAAKRALAELERIDTESPEFEAAFAQFRKDVEAHARREEAEVLPLLARSPADELESMGTAFAAAEAMAPTHAHQTAPESAIGNMLVGPFVAMVDRVRDAIRDARRKD